MDEFKAEIISKGSFIDRSTDPDCLFLIEAFTLKLNYVALNGYWAIQFLNTRDCYNTDEEFEECKNKRKDEYAAWKKQILGVLGIDPETSGVTITQSQSEVFTVVYIREIK